MDDAMRVADARAAYFAANGFSEAVYTARWRRLDVGPIPVVFPTTAALRRALPLHDLHHVATGYATTWTGEAEISAWELGAGCGKHWWAIGFSLGAMAIGLAIAPRRTYRAFLRGRRSRSLYVDACPAPLALSLRELRARLRLDDAAAPAATWRDRLAFARWIATIPLTGAVFVVAALSR
jgi:hypothetical protein